MRLTLPNITWPSWIRNTKGENFYDLTSMGEWTGDMTNMKMALNHPILTPAILFVAKVFSQAYFELENKNTGTIKNTGGILDLLEDPNQFQTREDFLETLMFVMIAQGVAVVALNKIIGFEDPTSMFVLDGDLIEWPDNYKNSKFRKNNPSVLKEYITYDKDGENIKYQIKDLMFFYDLPNGIQQNPFKVRSRMDGLNQTLINTKDSLVAKNIILKTNGKELITGKKETFPLSPDDKKVMENMINNKTGLSYTRKRGIVTQADLTWKSMHIALRDLGLDESVKVDGNLIYTALHIPKDILSLEAKKTTYNNFKESMVSYVQNEMQSSLNSFVAVFNKKFKSTIKLTGNYSHLPIMQFILLEKYDVVKKQAEALTLLRSAGVPDELAISMCGLPKGTVLGEMISQIRQQNNSESNGKEKREQPQLQKVWGKNG